jgi:hypothetical protein
MLILCGFQVGRDDRESALNVIDNGSPIRPAEFVVIGDSG